MPLPGLPPKPPKKNAAKSGSEPAEIRYVAQGTYGCVMRPAASCKGDGSIVTEGVSKIFAKEEYQQEEVRFQNTIAALDPHGEYTVRKLDECRINAAQLPKDELAKCRNLSAHPGSAHFWQIIYAYGGDDLHHLLKSDPSITFEEVFRGMASVFKGLGMLEKKRMVHQDIKPANLLFNKGTGKCYLIDFGLLTEGKAIFKSANGFALSYDYDYYPPEYKLYSAYFDQSDESTSSRIGLFDEETIRDHVDAIPWVFDPDRRKDVVPEMLDYVEYVLSNYIQFHDRCMTGKGRAFRTKYGDEVGNAFIGVLYYNLENLGDLQAFVKRMAATMDNPAKFVKKLSAGAHKIDVWMLGITLLEMVMRFEAQGRLAASNPAFLAAVLQLIRGMIRFDPDLRYTPRKAAVHYEKVLAVMDGPKLVRPVRTPAAAIVSRVVSVPQGDGEVVVVRQGATRRTKTRSSAKPRSSRGTRLKSAPVTHAAFVRQQVAKVRSLRSSKQKRGENPHTA
jgi:serine/threonine protein kinase